MLNTVSEFESPTVEDFRAARERRHAHKLKAFRSAKEAAEAGRWLRDVALKIQNESGNTAGGFVVPEPLAQAIIELRDKAGIARAVMQVAPMTSDILRVAKRESGSTAYYVDENAEITASQSSFSQITLSCKKLASLTRASSELMEDAVGLAEFVVRELAFNIEYAIDTAAFAGDGTSTYKGITGLRTALNSSLAGYVLAGTDHDTWIEYDASDLTNLVGKLPNRFHDNAMWLCSPQAWAFTFCRLAAGVGAPLAENGYPTYLGYPVVMTSTMLGGTVTTDLSGLVSIAFGDFSKAGILGDRRNGTRIFRSDSKFIEYDQVAWRATARFDINWHGLGDSTTAGAVVGLVGN